MLAISRTRSDHFMISHHFGPTWNILDKLNFLGEGIVRLWRGRQGRIGLWPTQLEATAASELLCLLLLWRLRASTYQLQLLCQMIQLLLQMTRGNLEHVNTIKVHSRLVQRVGFGIVMTWDEGANIPLINITLLLIIFNIECHQYPSVNQSAKFIWRSIFFLFRCATRLQAFDKNIAYLSIHSMQPCQKFGLFQICCCSGLFQWPFGSPEKLKYPSSSRDL